jgi:hypothetical protein
MAFLLWTLLAARTLLRHSPLASRSRTEPEPEPEPADRAATAAATAS